MTFLAEGYEVPKSAGGSYFKPQPGDNNVRILSDVVTGWQYWNDQNKPVRMREKPKTTPTDIRINDETGKPDRVKHFWVVLVWDYAESSLKVWEITQAGIQQDIAGFANDPDWGHPKNYNINIKKEGQKINTNYTVMPKPAKELDSTIVEAWRNEKVNLEAVFEDGAAPINYEGIMPDGAAGSYNESRAVRLLNDLVSRSSSDSTKLDQAKQWAMAPKQFTDINNWAGGDGEDYINSICCAPVAVGGGGVDASDIPFAPFGGELNYGA